MSEIYEIVWDAALGSGHIRNKAMQEGVLYIPVNKEWCQTICHAMNLAHERSGADELAEAMELILPLAKGYAAAHKVGGNTEYVSTAEAALAKWRGTE